METIRLVRFFHPEVGRRVGLQLKETVYDISATFPSISSWLRSSAGRAQEAIDNLQLAAQSTPLSFPLSVFAQAPAGGAPCLLAPVDDQDVWAAGVTYRRSRSARQEEAVDGGDIYARVYQAPRPELFFKAKGVNVIGPLGSVGIRSDAHWNVPEPELGLVINPALEIVGLVAGNDMSSRDIEGENPLYLPQAKVYTASCSLGPGLVLGTVADEWPDLAVSMRIVRNNNELFGDKIRTTEIVRSPTELVDYLGRCQSFPDGVILLTGTGIVPPADFSLQAGDNIAIDIESLGTLENNVIAV